MENTKLKSRLNTRIQTMQEAEQVQQLALRENAPAQSGYLALNDRTLELIHENLPDQSLNYQLFDVVKSPSGGSTVFTVPGLSGDEALATTASSRRTARSALIVPSMTTVPRTARPGPRPARSRCCSSCCGRAMSCRCWCVCR